MNILRIDSSAYQTKALSRKLGDEIIKRLYLNYPDIEVINRELTQGISFVNEAWSKANFTVPEHRDETQLAILSESDVLVSELDTADVVVLTTPMYNFSIPAVLKAWVDMIARAGLTFKYTDKGPVGLLQDKSVYLVITSGGVPVGSEIDFASGYLKHIFGFVGITDVRLIAAERTNADAAESELRALESLSVWLPAI